MKGLKQNMWYQISTEDNKSNFRISYIMFMDDIVIAYNWITGIFITILRANFIMPKWLINYDNKRNAINELLFEKIFENKMKKQSQ